MLRHAPWGTCGLHSKHSRSSRSRSEMWNSTWMPCLRSNMKQHEATWSNFCGTSIGYQQIMVPGGRYGLVACTEIAEIYRACMRECKKPIGDVRNVAPERFPVWAGHARICLAWHFAAKRTPYILGEQSRTCCRWVTRPAAMLNKVFWGVASN